MRALRVDAELSPLVRRKLSLVPPEQHDPSSVKDDADDDGGLQDSHNTILRTEYRATTNRMLRVAVNGFMESLGVVLQVMEELDVDVLDSKS